MKGSHEILSFVEINYGETPIRVHSGLGSLHLKTNDFYEYFGAGDLLFIEDVKSKTELDAVNFVVSLKNDSNSVFSQSLTEAALSTKLQDGDVCIRVVIRRNLDQKIPTENIITTRTAKVSHIAVNPDSISVECYTPSSQLEEVYESATLWSDLHQRKYVDKTDFAFRFANQGEENSGVIFP